MANTKKILVSGSWAYDYLMQYDGILQNTILTEKLDHLSAGFTVFKKSIHFGGCAGNIAYNLKLFGNDPLVVGLIGSDFGNYADWLKKNGIDDSTLTLLPNTFTASAYILTDREQNQIQIFHGGAMLAEPESVSMKNYDSIDVDWVIISPDDARRMPRLARECKELGFKYIFDPSQQISNIDEKFLREAVEGAEILIVNEYEADLLTKRLSVSREGLTEMVPTFIETRGEKGSLVVSRGGKNRFLSRDKNVRSEGETFFIPAVRPVKIVEPTGCGDAYRAGLLYGLSQGFGIEKSCQIGALTATYVIETPGTQDHSFTLREFKKRFEENFGEGF